MQQQISVTSAEPFSLSANAPHAIRLALGSVDMQVLRQALITVRTIIGAYL